MPTVWAAPVLVLPFFVGIASGEILFWESVKMKTIKTFIGGILAGVSIALGGTAFLSLESKAAGAVFFTVGLFTVCTFGFNLFTGKVCYIFANDRKYALDLLPIWLGNLIGAAGSAELLRLTRIGTPLAERAKQLCETKLDDSPLSIFILAIFCNILIFIAVDGFKNNPHDLGKYLALLFGVSVFVLCGFEHCVANMFYFSMAHAWSGKAIIYLLIMTFGNALGGSCAALVTQGCSLLSHKAAK